MLYPCIDSHLGEPHKFKREWASVMRCVAVFVGINHASAVSFRGRASSRRFLRLCGEARSWDECLLSDRPGERCPSECLVAQPVAELMLGRGVRVAGAPSLPETVGILPAAEWTAVSPPPGSVLLPRSLFCKFPVRPNLASLPGEAGSCGPGTEGDGATLPGASPGCQGEAWRGPQRPHVVACASGTGLSLPGP